MMRTRRMLATGCLAAGLLLITGVGARADHLATAPKSTLPHPERSASLPDLPVYARQSAEAAEAAVGPHLGREYADEAKADSKDSANSQAPSGDASGEPKETDSPVTSPAATADAKPVKRELSPEMVALRDQVRQILAYEQKQPFNTRDNSPSDIMHFCLGYGCATEVSLEGANGKKINGITSLCYNYPCGGFDLLTPCGNHIAARVGYGYQEMPGEFLAMLAMSRVPPTYPVRLGKHTRTVADLVESEKLACRDGADMSNVLIGLAYYADGTQWKNELGEDWSVERIIQREIPRPIVSASDGGVSRLMGLSFVVSHRIERRRPIEGQYQRAQKYVADYHDYALQMQNPDGSWGPAVFASRSATDDAAIQLWTTGRVVEWLALSLRSQRLEDPRVVRSVQQVVRLLSVKRYQRSVPTLPTREIVAFGHALHGLSVYDDRVFKPADAEPAPADQPATAERQTQPSPNKAADNVKTPTRLR